MEMKTIPKMISPKPNAMKHRFPIVSIIWCDAWGSEHRMQNFSLKQLKNAQLVPCIDVGILVDQNKERVVICRRIADKSDENDDNEEYKLVLVIPRCQIISMKKWKG